jgi:hypothetical protein
MRYYYDEDRQLTTIDGRIRDDDPIRCPTCGRAEDCCCSGCSACDILGVPREVVLPTLSLEAIGRIHDAVRSGI